MYFDFLLVFSFQVVASSDEDCVVEYQSVEKLPLPSETTENQVVGIHALQDQSRYVKLEKARDQRVEKKIIRNKHLTEFLSQYNYYLRHRFTSIID